METAHDRAYDAADRGYGAAGAEVDEETPPQAQQQPEHGGREAGDVPEDEAPEDSRPDRRGD